MPGAVTRAFKNTQIPVVDFIQYVVTSLIAVFVNQLFVLYNKGPNRNRKERYGS